MTAVALGLVGVASVGDVAAQPVPKPRPPAPPTALAPALAARLPADGFLIAHTTDRGRDDWFAITRIDRNGATELVHERTVPDAMTWLDAHTLVTVTTDVDSDVTTVRRYVDGQPQGAPLAVPTTLWTLPKGKSILDARPPELWLGKGGAIWLARCHTLKARGDDEVCTGTAWVRVDGTPIAAARAPKGVRRASSPPRPLPKAVKAPAGYMVRLGKVTVDDGGARAVAKGFTCTDPAGAATTWPNAAVIDWQFDVRPSKVTWLARTPPLFAVTGKATSPIDTTSTVTRVFRACTATALEDTLWLGDGRWMEMRTRYQGDQYEGTSWTLYVDDVAVGSVEASAQGIEVAPAP